MPSMSEMNKRNLYAPPLHRTYYIVCRVRNASHDCKAHCRVMKVSQLFFFFFFLYKAMSNSILFWFLQINFVP